MTCVSFVYGRSVAVHGRCVARRVPLWSRARVVIVLGVLVAALSGCDDGPGPVGPTTPTRTVGSVTVGGASFQGAVLPGQSVQLTATARYSDGTSEVVTTTVTWASSNGAVAAVSEGRVTAVGTGEATITARLPGVTPVAEGSMRLSVEIVPPLMLAGVVREAPPNAGRPVVGARVEVTGLGDTAPQVATTDGAGAYGVSDVRLPATVRVSKEGFDTLERVVESLPDGGRVDLLLVECCGRGGGNAEISFTDGFDATPDRALGDQTKRYSYVVGRAGTFDASVDRTGCSYNAYYGIAVELWDGDRMVARSGRGYSNCSHRLSVPVEAQRRYELRVIGAWVWGCCPYRVTVSYPE